MEPKPMVFCGLFPIDGDEFGLLRESLEKLRLNDSSFTYAPETSGALGFGFRCGFLGLLHMEIVRERLEREFGLSLIATAPSVEYRVHTVTGEVLEISNPSEMPEPPQIEFIEEPMLKVTILTPSTYTGTLMELCQQRRGEMQKMEYLSPERLELVYRIPLAEVVRDFFDQLKSRTQGYASLDYDPDGYERLDLVKVDVLLNGVAADAFSTVVHRDKAYEYGRADDREAAGADPAADVRRADPGGHRRQDHRPRDGQGQAQGRPRQVLRRRHHPQAQAAREAEGRQEEDEEHRAGRGAPGGLHLGPHPRRVGRQVASTSSKGGTAAGMTMLDERKAAILRAVVEEYIDTAQPVGSGAVAPQVKASSATVRNDMAVLEQEGYLRQPHTSAGRVPTEKGYRFFVDTLAEPAAAGCAAGPAGAVVLRPGPRRARAAAPRHHPPAVRPHRVRRRRHRARRPRAPRSARCSSSGSRPATPCVVVVLSNGVVEKHGVDLAETPATSAWPPPPPTSPPTSSASPPASLPGALPATGDADTDAAVDGRAGGHAPHRRHDDDAPVFVGGTARMASAFDAVDTVREVLSILEQQFVVVTVLRDVLDRGLQVAIGSETGLDPARRVRARGRRPTRSRASRPAPSACSGPSRMNYPQALAAVAVVSKRLGRHLTEG